MKDERETQGREREEFEMRQGQQRRDKINERGNIRQQTTDNREYDHQSPRRNIVIHRQRKQSEEGVTFTYNFPYPQYYILNCEVFVFFIILELTFNVE